MNNELKDEIISRNKDNSAVLMQLCMSLTKNASELMLALLTMASTLALASSDPVATSENFIESMRAMVKGGLNDDIIKVLRTSMQEKESRA